MSDKMEEYKRKWKDMKERVERITSFLLRELDTNFKVESWGNAEGTDVKVPIRNSDETLVFAVHLSGGTFIELEEDAEGDEA